MNGTFAAEGLSFLYRTDRGSIGRETWWLASLFLAIPLIAMTGIWITIRAYADPEGDAHPSVVATLLTYVYLFIYTFAVILAAVCHYNLSVKRWRDRGRPTWLACLLPLFAFLAAALTWYQPIAAGDVPNWEVLTLDAIFAVVAVWSVVELGLLPGAGDKAQ